MEERMCEFEYLDQEAVEDVESVGVGVVRATSTLLDITSQHPARHGWVRVVVIVSTGLLDRLRVELFQEGIDKKMKDFLSSDEDSRRGKLIELLEFDQEYKVLDEYVMILAVQSRWPSARVYFQRGYGDITPAEELRIRVFDDSKIIRLGDPRKK